MMEAFPQPRECVEKIMLETRPVVWVALSIGGYGILTRALTWRDQYGGGHDEHHRESRKCALEFASRVVGKIGWFPSHERVPTPQLLVDTATALNDGPTHVTLYCTTWQLGPNGLEICSVGSTSVLVFEKTHIQEAFLPHTANAYLKSLGKPEAKDARGYIATHGLGGPRGCRMEDVRVAHIPLSPTTTIAIIENRRLAEALMQREVPRHALSSFIDEWTPPGKRIRTSVLISL